MTHQIDYHILLILLLTCLSCLIPPLQVWTYELLVFIVQTFIGYKEQNPNLNLLKQNKGRFKSEKYNCHKDDEDDGNGDGNDGDVWCWSWWWYLFSGFSPLLSGFPGLCGFKAQAFDLGDLGSSLYSAIWVTLTKLIPFLQDLFLYS